jgi:hypothetical protein
MREGVKSGVITLGRGREPHVEPEGPAGAPLVTRLITFSHDVTRGQLDFAEGGFGRAYAQRGALGTGRTTCRAGLSSRCAW